MTDGQGLRHRTLRDISAPVSRHTPVYPGDEPFGLRWASSLETGAPVNLSTLTFSPHVGAHADAPLHYAAGGQAAGALDLAPFLGPCRVIHVPGIDDGLIRPAHLQHALQGLPPRVLVRTRDHTPAVWVDDFAAFAPATLDWLADLGVVLVGIDTPSVDPAASTTLDSHQVLARRGLRVLECLQLDDVPPGDYELIALPLRLMDAEASPVRAVLRSW